MNFGHPPFFSASEPPVEPPLERYLPPYQPGVLTTMLQYKGVNQGWLLDPIGSQPLAAVELARAGFRVVVASSNPLLAKLYEVICSAPKRAEVQAAISEFGALRIGEERLEVNINNLYMTDCPSCSEFGSTVKFIWKKGDSAPFAKEIKCRSCGFNGEGKISEFDLDKLKQIGNTSLVESRALQRVFPSFGDPPAMLTEVIQSYLPRSLSAVIRMMNKNDGYLSIPSKKRLVEASLILAFDYGTKLWGNPATRNRPKLITIPNQFWEFNLWDIIENSYKYLCLLSDPVPFTTYPELPPESGGICLYPHRIRRSEDLTHLPDFKMMVSVLPRPNQALWAYSVVWAGWLWGHAAVSGLKGVLERQRYDWVWHTHALKKLFQFSFQKGTPWLATAPELTPNYLLSFVSAPASSGYQLSDYAFHPEIKSAQLYWQLESNNSVENSNQNGILQYLDAKDEEASYQELLSITILERGKEPSVVEPQLKIDSEIYSALTNEFEKELRNPATIRKVDDDTLEYGEFWLSTTPTHFRPLADQIEIHFLNYLQNDPIVSFEEIESIINQKQPGVLPVPRDLLMKLLESYCDPIPGMKNSWQLRMQETVMIRRTDIRLMQKMIAAMGERIGLNVTSNPHILWETAGSGKDYLFFVSGSAIFSRFLDQYQSNSSIQPVIVYPGSRAELLSYKIKRSIVLAEKFKRIHFVKYRHIRLLNENPGLNLQTWEKLIDSDPAIWQEFSQPVLF